MKNAVVVLMRNVCACKPAHRALHTSCPTYFNPKDVENQFADITSMKQIDTLTLSDSSKGSPLPDFGFSSDSISRILELCPHLKKVPERELSERVDVWYRCRFGEKACITLLKTNPQLLTIPRNRLHDRVVKLFNHFSTNKNIYKLVSCSPNAVTETWSVVEAKLEYLLNEMKIPKAEIASSGAIAHNLEHMKTRFTFLSRAGRYRIPKPKETPDTQFKNPKLVDILNTEDKYFSTAVAGLSLLEYEVFRQLIIMEEEENSDNE